MTVLPEPPATTTGQATNPLTDSVIRAAVDNAIHEARRTGTAPPVVHPERPAMSAKAVDDSVRMLSASVLIATGGGATTAILWASGMANPTVVALVFGAPTALVLALGRLARRAKDVLPDEHHHHYSGPIRQELHTDQRRAVWQKDVVKQSKR
ncbi:hypothetical protein AB0D91_05285 [Streptomyces canus]|uniref:hypothetical protein n=1 Tax=Streptomyces canus TaxID=58343 RepID=UPI0033CE0154